MTHLFLIANSIGVNFHRTWNTKGLSVDTFATSLWLKPVVKQDDI